MKKLADSLYPKFLEMYKNFSSTQSTPCKLFLSTSDMKTRAIVRHAVADTPEDAWKSALEKLSDAVKSAKIKPKILKADFVTTREQLTFAMMIRRVRDTRRNYFRQGIAFDLDYNIVFTEQEINSNLMLYKPGETLESKNGEYRQENFEAYCQERFGTSMPKLTDSTPIEIFDTAGIFIEEGKEPLKITGIGNDAGHRDMPNITGEFVLDIAKSCAGYLASLVNKKGRFTYGLWPCVDKPVPKYNTPRHFSTLYAMLGVQEMYGPMGSIRLGKAIQNAVQYGVDKFTRYRKLDNGEEAAYFEDIDAKEFKLGANGIALITLARYTNQTHTKKFIPLMRAAARGIISMQKDDGGFVHVLNSSDYSLKDELRTVYYDGEAVFGLLRAYAITKDQWMFDAAVKAFEHFLEIDHWQNHDHWLSYAVNEITIYKPEARYFEFGIKNFKDFLPFIYHRETGYPTLLELTMAADDMLERMKKMPEMQDLLKTVDFDFFYSAIEARTRILLNTYLFPEVAMYFKRPESIVKGSYIRHHACRVRIDEVAHLVAGFANCSKFYKRREAEKKSEPTETTATMFYAGDVNIGRRTNLRYNETTLFRNIPAMKNSDLRVVNLECVIASKGSQGAEKGEGGPYYFHARPELTNALLDANIDVVTTANNHSGDYGPEALLEQETYLNKAGILHVGSGKNLEEASKPVYIRAGDLTVAVFSVDSTMKFYAADENKPGNFYLPIDKPDLWTNAFRDKIKTAHEKADVVIVATHWGINYEEKPAESTKNIAHLLIDLGADAIVACHAHTVQGVENYNNRPIIYDAGDFLFDGDSKINIARGSIKPGGSFQLTFTKNGVTNVKYIPLRLGYGWVEVAIGDEQVMQNAARFINLCRDLQTTAEYKASGYPEIEFNPAPREKDPDKIEKPSKLPRERIEPMSEPLQEWTVDSVPEDAKIEPVQFGKLKLIGCKIPDDCLMLDHRKMIYLDLYWTVDEKIDEDYIIRTVAVPSRECRMPIWGDGMNHEGCDWLFPTDRWQPGVIYREYVGIRPLYVPQIANVDLDVMIRVIENRKMLNVSYKYPKRVILRFPHTPWYREEFPEILYHSEPGKTWTAQQLEEVTGGKWIVAPPKGWYINSIVRASVSIEKVTPPTMYVASNHAQYAFHAGGSADPAWDTHTMVAPIADQIAGVIVDHKIEGLPANIPQLQVKQPITSFMELGIAARKRFQGKVIGITGSAGKTTTTQMINHVLSADKKCMSTYGNFNTRIGVPMVFASIPQDYDYAVLEYAASAMNGSHGSISYEINPDVAVVTSLSEAHMDVYKSLEGIAKIKRRIFDGMSTGGGGHAILNRDMPCFNLFLERAKSRNLNIITFGKHADATIHMDDFSNTNPIVINGKTYAIKGLVAPDQICDALAVVGVAMALNLPIETTLERLSTFQAVSGRGDVHNINLDGKNITLINSSYNANPISMKTAIETLVTMAKNRRVAILGDMLELGPNEKNLHREVGKFLGAKKIEVVITYGELSKLVTEEATKSGVPFAVNVKSLEEVVSMLKVVSADGDTVLIKSSHGMGLYQIADDLIANSK